MTTLAEVKRYPAGSVELSGAGNVVFVLAKDYDALKAAVKAAGPAIEAGAFCLEAEAHRHLSAKAKVASEFKTELALQLRGLLGVVKA